eukprot:4230976-Prymnesium_polylepis.3
MRILHVRAPGHPFPRDALQPGTAKKLAEMMVTHMDKKGSNKVLFPYQELADTDRAASLSPMDLKGRVLVKGKVKLTTRRELSNKTKKRCSIARRTTTSSGFGWKVQSMRSTASSVFGAGRGSTVETDVGELGRRSSRGAPGRD